MLSAVGSAGALAQSAAGPARSFSASAADMWNSRRTDPAVFSLVRGERGKPDICFDRTSFQIG